MLSADPDGSMSLMNTIEGVGEDVANTDGWVIRHDKPHGKVSFKKQK